jgi:uncharacterized protein (DUF2141 family)
MRRNFQLPRILRTAAAPLASWTGALIATFAFIGMTTWAHAADAPITVTIWSLRVPGGVVRVDVCTRKTFLGSNCPYSGSAPAQVGETTVTVADVPPGVYAIQAYHDIKDTGRLDQGLLGVPREGLAFSNDAPLGLRGPNFDRAAFTHGEEPQTLRLRLLHFRRAPPNAG